MVWVLKWVLEGSKKYYINNIYIYISSFHCFFEGPMFFQLNQVRIDDNYMVDDFVLHRHLRHPACNGILMESSMRLRSFGWLGFFLGRPLIYIYIYIIIKKKLKASSHPGNR